MNKFELELANLLRKYDCELINYEYFKKIFGNIVLEIRFKEKIHVFVSDRGEIYYNGELLCNYEYLRDENKTTPQKLLELIEVKLNSI